MPRRVTPRRAAWSAPIGAKPPLAAPCAENRPPSAISPKAAAPSSPPTPSKTTSGPAPPVARATWPGPVRLAVIHDRAGAQPGQQVQLGFPARGRDDLGPGAAGELADQDAQATGGAQDQDPLAGPDAGTGREPERGGPVVQDRGRFRQAHPAGHRDELARLDPGLLRVAARTAAPAGARDHGPPGPAWVNSLAHRADLPGHAVAGHIGRGDGKPGGRPPGPDGRVQEEARRRRTRR